MSFANIIIVGSGISGLYAAYLIKKMGLNVSVIILEKNKKKWIGGRANNETFRKVQVVTGAGILRKNKDKLVLRLLDELKIMYSEFKVEPQTQYINAVNIKSIMQLLRDKYDHDASHITFKEFASSILGDKKYAEFVTCTGYTDYEYADAYDVLYHYGMEDNICCWTGISLNYSNLIDSLHESIKPTIIKFSNNVVKITKPKIPGDRYTIETDNGKRYTSDKVILATTIDTITSLFPHISAYQEIKGQNFLRLYGKFSSASAIILKQYIKGHVIVSGPLQKIISMNKDEGVYMIAYSDGIHATYLKKYMENTQHNREILCDLISAALCPGIQLKLLAIKGYYWDIGTHYYTPLSNKYSTREAFIKDAQHPEDGMIILGEMVSMHQGWIQGALESVHAALTKKWILS